MFCSQCGAQSPAGNRFCIGCGKPMDAAGPAPAVAPPPVMASQPPAWTPPPAFNPPPRLRLPLLAAPGLRAARCLSAAPTLYSSFAPAGFRSSAGPTRELRTGRCAGLCRRAPARGRGTHASLPALGGGVAPGRDYLRAVSIDLVFQASRVRQEDRPCEQGDPLPDPGAYRATRAGSRRRGNGRSFLVVRRCRRRWALAWPPSWGLWGC